MMKLYLSGANLLIAPAGGFLGTPDAEVQFIPNIALSLQNVGTDVRVSMGPPPSGIDEYVLQFTGTVGGSAHDPHLIRISSAQGSRIIGTKDQVYGPFQGADIYKELWVAGVDSEFNLNPIGSILTSPRGPSQLFYSLTTGIASGQVILNILAPLPTPGDSTVPGDGLGGAMTLQLDINGGGFNDHGALATGPITLSGFDPGEGVIVIGRARTAFQSGVPGDSATATAFIITGNPPVNLGLMQPIARTTGQAFTVDWTTKFSGAVSFSASGISGGVQSGTGNKVYSVASLPTGVHTISVTATNAFGSTVAAWLVTVTVSVVAPTVILEPADISSAINTNFTLDLTTVFAGTAPTYASTPVDVLIGVVGSTFKNLGDLTEPRPAVNYTITASNAAGSASVVVAVTVTVARPAALVIGASAGVTLDQYAIERYPDWLVPVVQFPSGVPGRNRYWSTLTVPDDDIIPPASFEPLALSAPVGPAGGPWAYVTAYTPGTRTVTLNWEGGTAPFFIDWGDANIKVLTGSQGTAEYHSNNETFDVYNLYGATFNLNYLGGSASDYPFRINNSQKPRVAINGGTFLGNIPKAMPRSGVNGFYGAGSLDFNSALILIELVPADINGAVLGVIDDNPSSDHLGAVDGIRLSGGSQGSTIRNVIGYNIRDDIVESDNDQDFTIEDCWFDYAYSGFSGTGSVPGKVITMTRVYAGFRRFFQETGPSDVQHQHPFKVDSGGVNSPQWIINDCVIAVEQNDYPGTGRTADAFSRMSGTGNEWLFMGITQGAHPTPPAGWTVYTGAAATARWALHKAAFFARPHAGLSAPAAHTYAAAGTYSAVITDSSVTPKTATVSIPTATLSGTDYQPYMRDPAKAGLLTTPRADFSVFGSPDGTRKTKLVIAYEHATVPDVISFWSGTMTVPGLEPDDPDPPDPGVLPGVLPMILKDRASANVNLVTSAGMQFQRVVIRDRATSINARKSDVFTIQDENRSWFSDDDGQTWTFTPMCGMWGSKCAGGYANSDEGVAGLVVMVVHGWLGSNHDGGIFVSHDWGKTCRRIPTSRGGAEQFALIANGQRMRCPQNICDRRPGNSWLVTLGANPLDFTNASAVVTVNKTAHGLTVGRDVQVSGATSAAGLTIAGQYNVNTVPNANEFTITAASNANATVSGGGSAVKLHAMNSLSAAQRPTYFVEQVIPASSGTQDYPVLSIHVWKSTNIEAVSNGMSAATVTFQQTLPLSTYASGDFGICFVRVCPNGDVILAGRKGCAIIQDEEWLNPRIVLSGQHIVGCHIFGGDEDTPSGCYLASNSGAGGVLRMGNIRTDTPAKPNGNAGLPGSQMTSLEVWPGITGGNTDKMIVSLENASMPYRSVNGAQNWSQCGNTAVTGDPNGAYRYGFRPPLTAGHMGFFVSHDNPNRVLGLTAQTMTFSTDGGLNFNGNLSRFFDGSHTHGRGEHKTDWSQQVVIQQDRTFLVSDDGLVSVDTDAGIVKDLMIDDPDGAGQVTLGTVLTRYGGGSQNNTQGAGCIIGPSGRYVLFMGRQAGKYLPVLIGAAGTNPYGTVIPKDLGISKCLRQIISPVANNAWFLGRWYVVMDPALTLAQTAFTTYGNSIIGFSHTGPAGSREFRTYWTGEGTSNTSIFVSTANNGSGQSVLRNGNSGMVPFDHLRIAADPFVKNRFVYVANSAKNQIRIMERNAADTAWVDSAPAGGNFNVRMIDACEARGMTRSLVDIPSNMTLGQIVFDYNMEGLVYVVASGGTDHARTEGVPCVWRSRDGGVTWSDITGNAPLANYDPDVSRLTGNFMTTSSMGTWVWEVPSDYPNITHRNKIYQAQVDFYSRPAGAGLPAVPNPPVPNV